MKSWWRRYGNTWRTTFLIENEQPGKTGRAWLMAGYAALQINDVNAGRRALKRAAEYKSHRKAALQAIQRLPKS